MWSSKRISGYEDGKADGGETEDSLWWYTKWTWSLATVSCLLLQKLQEQVEILGFTLFFEKLVGDILNLTFSKESTGWESWNENTPEKSNRNHCQNRCLHVILLKTGKISGNFLRMIKPRWEAGQCLKVNNGRSRTGECSTFHIVQCIVYCTLCIVRMEICWNSPPFTNWSILPPIGALILWWCAIIYPQQQQSNGVIDLTRVTLSQFDSINAIHFTRVKCWMSNEK